MSDTSIRPTKTKLQTASPPPIPTTPTRWRSRTEQHFDGKKRTPKRSDIVRAVKILRREGSLRSKSASAAAFLLAFWRSRK